MVPKPVWNGKHYDFENELPAVPKAGQRPIVAFVGGDNSLAAVQFVEFKSEIVGEYSAYKLALPCLTLWAGSVRC